MRRIWTVAIAAIVFSVLLAGCGNKDESSSGKTYKIATDASYAPMEFMDGDKLVGFDVDFIAAVMKEAGLNYTLVNTGWDPMLEYVKQGKEYDAGISSVSITEERKKTYDYTSPYFESTNMILVNEGSTITNALDLKDKKVGVQISTTADTIMTGIMGQGNSNLKRFDSNTLALIELEKNGVDAVVADNMIVGEYIKHNPAKKFVGINDKDNFIGEFYGILLPKGSELKQLLDPAIKKVLESGEYNEIHKSWFGQEWDVKTLFEAQ